MTDPGAGDPRTPQGREAQSDLGQRTGIWRRMSPAVISVGYALVALVWIITSDLVASEFERGTISIDLSLAKGFGFVLVTGGLLYLVLRRRERWLTAADRELSRWTLHHPATQRQDRYRVLLIDDDPDDLLLLGRTLRAAPGVVVEVEEAATPAAGRAAILESRHDAIFVAERLPGSSGLDLINELHDVASGPMILTADSDDPDLDHRASARGAYDFVAKDQLDRASLGRTLRYAVANWSAEQDVARTRQWYAEMVRHAPIGLFKTTADGRVLEANQAAAEIFGAASPDAMVDVDVAGLYADPGLRSQMIARIAAGEPLDDVEVEGRKLDGTRFVGRLRVRAVADSHGILVLYGAIADVTDQRRAAARIRLQATMLDQIQNAVFATDVEGQVIYWNHRSAVLFGWTEEEALGRSILDLTPAVSEQRRGAEIMASILQEGSWEGEFLCRRKDGSTFPAFVKDTVLTDEEGVPVGVLGVVVDMTEVREAERRAAAQAAMARSVLESVRFPAAVIDGDGWIVAVNEAWRGSVVDGTGSRATVGVGANYPDSCRRMDPADAGVVEQGIRSVLAGDADAFEHEYAGGDRWFRLEVMPALDPLGGAVVIHIDITDLHRTAEQAEEFARSKDRLIASVSHELRTPLTAVLGFAELMDDPGTLTRDELVEYATEIRRQAGDMAAIVEDLLVAARAEMGSLRVHIAGVDLVAQIADVVSSFRDRGGKAIRNEAQPVPPVAADPLRLRQVIRNLVVNAIRYGGSTVTIRTGHDGSVVRLIVADDGPGVPTELSDAIFEPFVTAHDRGGQPDALGLGLSVVRTLAEAMEGSVTVASDGGWTTFTVSLPVMTVG